MRRECVRGKIRWCYERAGEMRAGDVIEHRAYGHGVVRKIEGTRLATMDVTIRYEAHGERVHYMAFILSKAPMARLKKAQP